MRSHGVVVRQHAASVVGEQRDALTCARRIEVYVRTLVSDKSMDVGFATAAEVARTGPHVVQAMTLRNARSKSPAVILDRQGDRRIAARRCYTILC